MDLAEIVERAVTGLGYEFVDLETSPRGRLLRVFIDAPSRAGGVTVDDCAAVSNHLTRLFVVENIDYDRLEVSSPGLDRPLKRAADFIRFAGHEVQVKLRIAVGTQRNFTGVLGGIENDCVVIQVPGAEHRFELAQIEKARLVPNYDETGKTEGRR
jgi:ribosome maturation factor RimP